MERAASEKSQSVWQFGLKMKMLGSQYQRIIVIWFYNFG